MAWGAFDTPSVCQVSTEYDPGEVQDRKLALLCSEDGFSTLQIYLCL